MHVPDLLLKLVADIFGSVVRLNVHNMMSELEMPAGKCLTAPEILIKRSHFTRVRNEIPNSWTTDLKFPVHAYLITDSKVFN